MKKECEVLQLFRLLGKKWSIHLLHLIGDGPIGYNQIYCATNKKINPSLLSNRLNSFAEFGLVNKRDVNGSLCYLISAKGISLRNTICNEFGSVFSLRTCCNSKNCVCHNSPKL